MKTNYCGEWTSSEVLPDEDGNCSLCGSKLNDYGECQYYVNIDRLLSNHYLLWDALKCIKDEAEKPEYVRDNEYILAKANVALGLTSQGNKKKTP